MAFRKKAEFILTEEPDILIVPECENLEKLKFNNNTISPNDLFWYGDNSNKGIGVFSYCDLKISLIKDHNSDFKYIIPLSIKGNNIEFILLAIWCQKPYNSDNYGIHTWNAIKYYKDLLKTEKVIIAGDLNSNSIWDKPNREANHSNIVRELQIIGIESTYHFYNEEEQGKESNPTLHLHRNFDKPYHIDYCFASDFFMKRLKQVKIGTYENWAKYSDHNPVIIDYEI
jgi:exonuclease III